LPREVTYSAVRRREFYEGITDVIGQQELHPHVITG